jgi:hypothetical protein
VEEWTTREGLEMSKFSSDLAREFYLIAMDGHQDEMLGDTQGFGWYARFDGERVILSADNYGFVIATQYDSDLSFYAAWRDIEEGYDEWLNEWNDEGYDAYYEDVEY